MNAKNLIASVSLIFAAGAAFAEPADLNFPSLGKSAQQAATTREAVKAEVIRARNAGELELSEVTYPPLVSTPSALTREQVKADVLAARAAGELDLNEVNYPSFFDARVQRAPNVTPALTASAKRSAAAQ
jgi:hypothetical protein